MSCVFVRMHALRGSASPVILSRRILRADRIQWSGRSTIFDRARPIRRRSRRVLRKRIDGNRAMPGRAILAALVVCSWPAAAHSEIIVNAARPITHRVTVQLIQTALDNGIVAGHRLRQRHAAGGRRGGHRHDLGPGRHRRRLSPWPRALQRHLCVSRQRRRRHPAAIGSLHHPRKCPRRRRHSPRRFVGAQHVHGQRRAWLRAARREQRGRPRQHRRQRHRRLHRRQPARAMAAAATLSPA